MGFAGVTIVATKRASTLARVAPYYGIASGSAPMDEGLIKGLAFRGNKGTRNVDFAIDAGGFDNYMFFASPVQFGECGFLDVQSQFVGAWDGANAPAYGPIIVPVTIETGEVVDFYLYRTDHDNLGSAEINQWSVL